jgi:hypothetical protein
VKKTKHRHRWVEDMTAPDTGVGAEWHYDCSCGAHKYEWVDAANESGVEITEPGE